MTDLYLIAHKVRGETAFDVATKIDDMSRDEAWWLIPTSGHRAYPFWHEHLGSLLHTDFEEGYLAHLVKNPPADLRDHYQNSDYTDRATRPSRSERPQTIPTLEDI